MSQSEKTYETEAIKIYWRPDVCQHAAECVRGLPSVFDVKKNLGYLQKTQHRKKL